MRALVTGGAGFIGSHLVDALVAGGHEVVVLDNLATGRRDNVHAAARFVEGDVADPADVDAAVAGCDVVFHQAALGSVPRSLADPLTSDRSNVRGTLAVLDGARRAGVHRVVLASSSSVYGGAEQVPTPETAPLAPRSPYAVTKLAGEHYARVHWEVHGLETVALRYFNVFGPRQRLGGPYAAVIPLFVDALLTGDAPVMHGDGLQSRDFTFVTDAVQANLRAAAAPAARCAGRAFNIARGDPVALVDLLALLADEVGVTATPVHAETRPGDVRRSHADITAARRDLGYEPAVALRTGLARTVAWYRASVHAPSVPG
ncbi:MAG TPA: NAD-dependent epimerase/dehydratase family protein [Acidimicrobiales bacterium]|nr:NAD-dependent epimerase/dehydratase family protein [Acidimicrobiales bacterium]